MPKETPRKPDASKANHLKPHRFQKGNPGGPGRPKGSVSPLEELRRELNENPDIARAVVRNWIRQMLKDDHRAVGAIDKLIDRIDGPVTTQVVAHITQDFVIEWQPPLVAGDQDEEKTDGNDASDAASG